MCDQEQDHCERCDDTGWIAVRTGFPMSYVGPGPCPDYARGVCDAACDRCDRGYALIREQIARAARRARQRRSCPECGFDPERDEGCLAFKDRGYCPHDRGETGVRERSPYKPVEPDPNAPDFDDEVPF